MTNTNEQDTLLNAQLEALDRAATALERAADALERMAVAQDAIAVSTGAMPAKGAKLTLLEDTPSQQHAAEPHADRMPKVGKGPE